MDLLEALEDKADSFFEIVVIAVILSRLIGINLPNYTPTPK